jgi:hypothetical protein
VERRRPSPAGDTHWPTRPSPAGDTHWPTRPWLCRKNTSEALAFHVPAIIDHFVCRTVEERPFRAALAMSFIFCHSNQARGIPLCGRLSASGGTPRMPPPPSCLRPSLDNFWGSSIHLKSPGAHPLPPTTLLRSGKTGLPNSQNHSTLRCPQRRRHAIIERSASALG